MTQGIGDRVQAVRKRLGLSVKNFAEVLGIGPHRIQDIERCKQRAPSDVLAEVCRRFDVDANWLLTGDGQMFQEGTTVLGASAIVEAQLDHTFREDMICALVALAGIECRLAELTDIVDALQARHKPVQQITVGEVLDAFGVSPDARTFA